MKFIIYDVIFLSLFLAIFFLILYFKRDNLKREGLLFIYRTHWGMKFIDRVGKKYKKSLGFLSYISIGVGYILMAGSLYLFGRIIWVYLTKAAFVKAIKIPPIMPIIPYIDKIVPNFGFPPFYFTYFIIILGLIAIPHEFFHGIFMRLYKIKVKSTGFGFFPFFFPVFPAAFVEQDEKSFEKAGKFEQMSVLSAGTFANFLTAVLFFAITLAFFSSAFHPAGVIFDDYAFNAVPISNISMVNNISLINPDFDQIVHLLSKNSSNEIIAGKDRYLGVRGVSEDRRIIYLYFDSPAIKNKLKGAITEIDNNKVSSPAEVNDILSKKHPGEIVKIKTKIDGKEKTYKITLDKSPFNKSKSWLGVYLLGSSPIVYDHKMLVPYIGKKNIYYEPLEKNSFFLFLEGLFEWIVLISISVALVNMIPVGMFDGGRFFYLTIWGLTKKEKIAQKSFKFMTFLAILLLFLMMVSWVVNVFIR